MKFIIGSSDDAARYCTERLQVLLKNGPVVWLVSGGSNIQLQVHIMDKIPNELTKNLTILPVDERYGPYDHSESNSAKLRNAGFNAKQAVMVDILEDTRTISAATAFFNDTITENITNGSYFFATLGLGADGHTAGILPKSIALTTEPTALHYKAADFNRITLSAGALVSHCNEAIVCAFGTEKHQALHALMQGNNHQVTPAVVLKQVKNCVVYNDIIKGEIV